MSSVVATACSLVGEERGGRSAPSPSTKYVSGRFVTRESRGSSMMFVHRAESPASPGRLHGRQEAQDWSRRASRRRSAGDPREGLLR